MATSKQKIVEELLSGPFIFVPYSCGSRHEDIVPGVFLSSSEVYWRDLNVSVNQIKEMHPHNGSNMIDRPLCKTLSNVYPSLHDFFVSECGVSEIPRLRSYLHILLQLSTVALASQAANMVSFQIEAISRLQLLWIHCHLTLLLCLRFSRFFCSGVMD